MAWRSLEPNEVGVNEFTKWCKKADSDVMMAVNLGTRGISDAYELRDGILTARLDKLSWNVIRLGK